jgi:predicted GNAT family acetyltransferase
MTDIVNNRAHHRYELAVDGHIAATYYAIVDGVITFIHTEVPPELGGKGIASKLIRGALDQVRGLKGDRAVPVRESLHRQARGLSGFAEMRSI